MTVLAVLSHLKGDVLMSKKRGRPQDPVIKRRIAAVEKLLRLAYRAGYRDAVKLYESKGRSYRDDHGVLLSPTLQEPKSVMDLLTIQDPTGKVLV